ncbi:MAG: hypothetical protein HOQ09_10840 [Gemmatimonadaceae bacterium]|nr:hypothetical protein [Gemmatimonadaceae bacterium]
MATWRATSIVDPRRGRATGVLAIIVAAIAAVPVAAQTSAAFGTCVPRAQRAHRSDVGCFIITEQKVGPLAGSVFWHVTRFTSAARARAAAKRSTPAGTVIQAFGRGWLLTIADSAWRASAGTPVATIGPLPVSDSVSYAALYMEASMRPGMKSQVHRHSGAEAWYTLGGETCLETPTGTQVGRAGGPPVIVPGGVPMELTATGTTLRKSLVLILHDASQKPTTMEHAWTPKGLCKPGT